MKVYQKPGPENTEETIRLAVERAIAMDHAPIVTATTRGGSSVKLCEIAKDMGFKGKIVVVTHAYGFSKNGENSLKDEIRAQLVSYGAIMVTAAHVLSGAERGISNKFQGAYPVEIMAHTLRVLSQGVKVAVEIATMALDNGAIPYGIPIVCMGGTGGGVDTAVIMSPAHANKIFETNIHEILCMPY